MKKRSIFNGLCLAISIACLSLGYIFAGHWLILAAFPAIILSWLFMKKWSVFGAASILLFIYILLAAIGVLANLPMPLLIVGCTSALASWDLSLFARSMGDCPIPETQALMGKYHLRSLAAMCCIGLCSALISTTIDLKLSFGLIVSLALLSIGGLIYGIRYTRKSLVGRTQRTRGVS